MKRIACALVIFVLVSCRNESPFAEEYVFKELPSGGQLELSLNGDGSYEATSSSRGELAFEEQGTWQTDGTDLTLSPTSGGLPHPVHRLRSDEQRPGHLL